MPDPSRDDDSESEGLRRGVGNGRAWLLLWIAVAASGAGLARDLLVHWERTAAAPAVAALRIGALCAALLALALAVRRWRAGGAPPSAAPVFIARVVGHCALVAFVVSSAVWAWTDLAEQTALMRSVFQSTLLLGASLWMLALVAYPGLEPAQSWPWRWLDVLAFNVLIAFVALEALVSLAGSLRPSELLFNSESVVSRLAAYRLAPGTLLAGHPINSGGFYDDEFFAAEDDDLVVAVLTDSFGLAAVPRPWGFPAVAERELSEALSGSRRRVAVHNFGVASIGMGEYAWLLEHEVLRTNPELVILCIFVGNDISGAETRYRLDAFQQTRVYALARRLLAVGRASARGDWTGGEPSTPDGLTPDFVLDVNAERPSFDLETFLEVERDRLEISNVRNEDTARNFDAFFRTLEWFDRRLGERLLVLLIPDEFQVNDELYETLVAEVEDADAYERDHPQEMIATWCGERGIALVDLLEPLRAAQREGRVYHLQDTHWNARGNRIAGEAIAEEVLDRLSRGEGRISERRVPQSW